ncbi:aminotransferase class I/II-fold pyridoxal phosphate-dependent enzyme (plasmid) [Rhizobium leguminosarum]|nr:aminotransferase class I/II-fold pyridoxal phosphate-dependent enzyme [Rhizobium leguminosarum]UIL31552.1 aminotransferase class I/II-fold pyridoxal phosphate-dependent enzyme [Rhizobium leguminosarum]
MHEISGQDHAQTKSAKVNFLLEEKALRRRQNLKWSTYGEEVLPAFVAEMDYEVAPAIHEALVRVTAGQQYGYPARSGRRTSEYVAELYAARMSDRFDWQVKAENVVVVSDLVQAIFTTVLAFSREGDGIAIQNPCYPPFREATTSTGRMMIPIETKDDGTRLSIDFEGLSKAIGPQTRLLMLCNPHNPTGRVLERSELENIADLVCANDLLLVSDEVHSEITFGGARHVPIGSLGKAIGERTITLGSAAKSFNIAGLKCAFIHFGSNVLRDRYLSIFPRRVIVPGHVMGIDATIAAWELSHTWQRDVMLYLGDMRNLLMNRLQEEIPEIRVRPPQGTYMAWLDCSELQLPCSAHEFFLTQARVGLSAGNTFLPHGDNFVRLNFATSEKILNEILDRMVGAIRYRS